MKLRLLFALCAWFGCVQAMDNPVVGAAQATRDLYALINYDISTVTMSRAERIVAVEHALQRGANSDYQNRFGESLFFIAASRGKLDLVNVLLRYNRNIDINQRDNNGETALLEAVGYNQDSSIVLGLLKLGIDVNCINRFGNTALDYAIMYDNKQHREVMLSWNSNPERFSGNEFPALEVQTVQNALDRAEQAYAVILQDDFERQQACLENIHRLRDYIAEQMQLEENPLK